MSSQPLMLKIKYYISCHIHSSLVNIHSDLPTTSLYSLHIYTFIREYENCVHVMIPSMTMIISHQHNYYYIAVENVRFFFVVIFIFSMKNNMKSR